MCVVQLGGNRTGAVRRNRQMAFAQGWFRGCTRFHETFQFSSRVSLRSARPTMLSHTARNRICSNASEPENVVLTQSSLQNVEKILHHHFRSQALLAQALTHRSVVNKRMDRPQAFYEDRQNNLHEISENNERHELLGDRVFGLLAAHTVYEKYADKSEGELSKDLQVILSRKKAGMFFWKLGLHKYILEAKDLKGQQGSRYGDCFEALLAVLYLDGGFQAAELFFQSRVVPHCDVCAGDHVHGNYKQMLQEYLVMQGLPSPALQTQVNYIPVSYDHDTGLSSQAIQLFGRHVSVGTGLTRVSADQDAARRLFETLQSTKATCFLIRLARQAGDQQSLKKLQATRAAQIVADSTEARCVE